MKVYIAGPMSGLPDFNYPAFHAAAKALRERYPERTFINPAENYDGDQTLPRERYFKAALPQVIGSDAVVALPDWWMSEGALTEVKVALMTGTPVYKYEDESLLPLDTNISVSWMVEFMSEGHEDEEDTHLDDETDLMERLGSIRNMTDKAASLGKDAGGERITEIAWNLVHGDRGAAYGHPSSDFTAMGRISGAIIERWLESQGLSVVDLDSNHVLFPDIEPRIVALIQQAVKLSRESANPKRDNRIDGIGYWLCSDRIVEDY